MNIARGKFWGLPQNRKTLKRYGSSNNIVDNFDYNYISGTNKLRKVAGLSDQYEYDNNGNMIQDDVNRNDTLIYDHRNLLTEFGSTRTVDSPFGPVDEYYHTYYYYDEAGNRIRKIIWKYNGGEPEPIFAEDSPYWDVFLNEFYVRDVNGKEIAIYQDTTLYQWNVWGLDNVGKIDSYGDRFFYLKDHLGSIRAIVDSRYNVVSAQDYDMWGNILENRSYILASNKYKFTGKERDNESNYDYFGARYYDARIGRWGGVEPKFDNFVNWSSYNYSLLNPLIMKDANGKDPRRNQMANLDEIVAMLSKHIDENIEDFIVKELPGDENLRYVYTEEGGFIDLMHFFAAAEVSSGVANYDPSGIVAYSIGLTLGNFVEIFQSIKADESQWDPEDLPSNEQGARFGVELGGETKISQTLIDKFTNRMKQDKILDKDDPKIGRDKVRIRENKNDEPLKQRYSYSPYRGDPVSGKAIKGI